MGPLQGLTIIEISGIGPGPSPPCYWLTWALR